MPRGKEGYYRFGDRKVLVLTGQEIHNQSRIPQKSHLLAFNTKKDLSHLADQPALLIQRIQESGGLSFIAHPVESELKAFHEPDISWEDWDANGYNGIELWNGFSEIKHISRNGLEAAFYALFPDFLAHQPHPKAFELWNRLLRTGQPISAVCGSDAHQLVKHIGPFKKLVYPYEYHFRALNNHLLLPSPLTGDLQKDKKAVYLALRQGHSFIGYDLPHLTHGFHFTAQGQFKTVSMGEEISSKGGITFQVKTPAKCKILLFRDEKPIQRWKGGQVCTYSTSSPGVYRIEAWINYLGQRRAWILSNPIYVREK